MRIVVVWLTALILLFVVSVGWYASLPIVIGVSQTMANYYSESSLASNIALAIEYVTYAWGPLLDLFIVLWAIMSSQRRDVESEVYG